MTLRRVAPAEAQEMMENDGYVYLDVRSVPEFEAGHPRGAYNIPLLHMGPFGMTPNPRFVETVQRTFSPQTRLILGCKAGGRSLRAAAMLLESGYTDVVDQRAGFDGHGEPGWRAVGLPVGTAADPGRAWEQLEPKG